MVKYNLHRALAEKKMLEKRINSILNSFEPVGTKKGSDSKVYETKTSIEDFSKDVKSKYQQIQDLIYNYNALDKAIVISNSITKVNIGNKEYTVADAIKRKDNIEFEQDLLRKMKQSHSKGLSNVNSRNQEVEKRLDEQTINMEKQDKEQWSNVYRKQNEWKVIDPIGIISEIEKLELDIDEFLTEVDYALSTSNAITIIDVDLK